MTNFGLLLLELFKVLLTDVGILCSSVILVCLMFNIVFRLLKS